MGRESYSYCQIRQGIKVKTAHVANIARLVYIISSFIVKPSVNIERNNELEDNSVVSQLFEQDLGKMNCHEHVNLY